MGMVKQIIFIVLLFSLTCLAAEKDKTYGNVIVSEITSIYDGDTFRCNIRNFPSIIGQRMGIRIAGIDTPEMRGKTEREKTLAKEAKQFTVEKLRNAKKIELRNMKRGKYFRIVANVFVDGRDLGKMLIKAGLAVAYDGGTKKKW